MAGYFEVEDLFYDDLLKIGQNITSQIGALLKSEENKFIFFDQLIAS
jgi:hypothetical protein